MEVAEGKTEAKDFFERWYVKWHGEGEPQQALLYRCLGCQRLLTHNIIKQGMCGCGANRLSPANPTYWQLFRLMCLPWTVKVWK